MTADALYEALLHALTLEGCAICRIPTSALFDHMCRFQHDVGSDEGPEAHLLCGHHLWYLVDLASPSALVRFTVPQLRVAAVQARACATDHRHNLVPLDANASDRGVGCEACDIVRVTTHALVRDLASLTREDHSGDVGTALCAPHLATVVSELCPTDATRVLDRWSAETKTLADRLESGLAIAAIGRRKRLPGLAGPRDGIGRLVGWRTHRGVS